MSPIALGVDHLSAEGSVAWMGAAVFYLSSLNLPSSLSLIYARTLAIVNAAVALLYSVLILLFLPHFFLSLLLCPLTVPGLCVHVS